MGWETLYTESRAQISQIFLLLLPGLQILLIGSRLILRLAFAQLSLIYASALVFGETTTGTLTACVIGSVAMFFCCLLEVPVINWAAQ